MKIRRTINAGFKDNYPQLNDLCFLGRQSVKIIASRESKRLFARSPRLLLALPKCFMYAEIYNISASTNMSADPATDSARLLW